MGTTSVRMRVVGVAVTPDLDASGGVGQGAVLSRRGLGRLAGENPPDAFLVTLRPNSSPEAFQGRAFAWQDEHLTRDVTLPSRPADVANLHRVRAVPLALAGILCLVAALTLAHVLAATVHARRRDLAVLRALGFVRGQVAGAVFAQATVMVVTAVALSVPTGVALGRWTWTSIAQSMGTIAQPATPGLALAAVAVAAIVLANVVAAVPGFRARRVRPAQVLRAQ